MLKETDAQKLSLLRRLELETARSLLPLARANIKAPFSEQHYTTDSSESHYCVISNGHSAENMKLCWRAERQWQIIPEA